MRLLPSDPVMPADPGPVQQVTVQDKRHYLRRGKKVTPTK
jgi:hypothetical protein